MSPNFDDRIRTLTEVIQENDAKLFAMARSWLRSRSGQPSREEVQDVLSDAYVTAITKIRQDPTLELRIPLAWFMRVLFFTSLRHARQHLFVVKELELEDRLLNRIADPAASDSESKAVIGDALKAAAGDDLQILELAAEGYTSEEIGARLGISAESARKRKSRALQRVRSVLEGDTQ